MPGGVALTTCVFGSTDTIHPDGTVAGSIVAIVPGGMVVSCVWGTLTSTPGVVDDGL